MKMNKGIVILTYLAAFCWVIIAAVRFFDGDAIIGALYLVLGILNIVTGVLRTMEYREQNDEK